MKSFHEISGLARASSSRSLKKKMAQWPISISRAKTMKSTVCLPPTLPLSRFSPVVKALWPLAPALG